MIGGLKPWSNPRIGILYAALLSLCLTLLLPVPSSPAAIYPIRPVTLLLPWPEKDQGERFFNLLLPFLQKHAGTIDISIKHVPGRGGGTAWAALARSPGDGYSLAALGVPAFFLQDQDKNRLYSSKELAPVAIAASVPLALWVKEDSALRSLADLITYARMPGNRLIVSGTGSYTEQNMASLLFDRAAGIKSLYLPYLGSEEAAEAVRDGTAQTCWGYALDGVTMSGMRPLAVAAKERGAALGDTPTFAEAGTPLEVRQYLGLCLPAATPEETRQQAAALFSRAAADPEFVRAVAALGFQPLSHPYYDMPVFIAVRQGETAKFLADYPLARY